MRTDPQYGKAQYVLAGTRRTLHRLPTQEGCNVDAVTTRKRFVFYGQAVRHGFRRRCRHCFPRRGR